MSEPESPAAAIAFFRSGSSNSTYRVELVVSGRIAAIGPLPSAASGFSAAIALKSFVNDVAEIDGVAPPVVPVPVEVPVDAADDVAALLVVAAADDVALLELLDELLPHAAIARLAANVQAAISPLLLSKCML